MASDFRVQRLNVTDASGTSFTFVAGRDYYPPAVPQSKFFVRTHEQYAGRGNANHADGGWVCTNVEDIQESLTFERTASGTGTDFLVEIVEYVGPDGGPNEMVVHSKELLTFGSGSTTVNGTAVTGVLDDSDVMTLVCGSEKPSFAGEDGLCTSAWDSGNQRAVVTRGNGGANTPRVFVSVIEWRGGNWTLSDVSLSPATARTVQNATVSVADVTKTVLFEEMRSAAPGTGNISPTDTQHTLNLTSATNVAAFFGNGDDATNITLHVWLLENAATEDPMVVQRLVETVPAATAAITGTLGSAITDPLGVSIESFGCASGLSAEDGTIQNTQFGFAPPDHPDNFAESNGLASDTAVSMFRGATTSAVDVVTQVVQWPGKGVFTDVRVQRFWVNWNSTFSSLDTRVVALGGDAIQAVAGRDYAAPDAANRAFVRPLGSDVGRCGIRNYRANTNVEPSRAQVVIEDQSDLTTGFSFGTYFAGFNVRGRMMFELVEYVGEAGGPNEFIVRGDDMVNMTSGTTEDTATISGVADANDLWLLDTGFIANATLYGSRLDSYLTTLEWVGASNVVRFTRQGSSLSIYASCVVVEFTGSNWTVQRLTPSAGAATVPVDVAINPIGSVFRGFVWSQARSGTGSADSEEECMWQAWLTDESTLTVTAFHATNSADLEFVCWVISNSATVDPLIVERLQLDLPTDAVGLAHRQYTQSLGSPRDFNACSAATPGNGTNLTSSDTSVSMNDIRATISLGQEEVHWAAYRDGAYSMNYNLQVVQWPGARQSSLPVAGTGGAGRLVNNSLVDA